MKDVARRQGAIWREKDSIHQRPCCGSQQGPFTSVSICKLITESPQNVRGSTDRKIMIHCPTTSSFKNTYTIPTVDRSGPLAPRVGQGFSERYILCSFLMSIVLVLITCQAQDNVKRTKEEIHALHRDSKAYIAMLEDPERDSFQKPHEVLAALDLKEGEVIADIGAGSGYFTFRFSRHVGETGRVYAVDISPDMIIHMNRKIRELGTKNVITILAPPDDPLLPSLPVDRLFFCDTWHHIENQTQYLKLLKRILKPSGQLIMIDFHKKELPVGPPVEMKIAREDLISQMESANLQLAKEFTFLPYQYFLLFKAK